MYTPGNIIYYTPFYFKNGKSSCKEKYFIVFHVHGNSVIIAGLPTRVDHVPSFIEKKHGCIKNDSISFCCYFIENGRPITENNWAFPLDTHIYSDEIDEFPKSTFEDIYRIPDVDFKIIGKLKEKELQNMIACFKNSRATKRKVRRILGAAI